MLLQQKQVVLKNIMMSSIFRNFFFCFLCFFIWKFIFEKISFKILFSWETSFHILLIFFSIFFVFGRRKIFSIFNCFPCFLLLLVLFCLSGVFIFMSFPNQKTSWKNLFQEFFEKKIYLFRIFLEVRNTLNKKKKKKKRKRLFVCSKTIIWMLFKWKITFQKFFFLKSFWKNLFKTNFFLWTLLGEGKYFLNKKKSVQNYHLNFLQIFVSRTSFLYRHALRIARTIEGSLDHCCVSWLCWESLCAFSCHWSRPRDTRSISPSLSLSFFLLSLHLLISFRSMSFFDPFVLFQLFFFLFWFLRITYSSK